jgi:5,10-methylenetetrahydromethanopterin reductase
MTDLSNIRFGTASPVRSIPEYLPWLRAAEGHGFDLIGCGDSQNLWADPYVAMTIAATETSSPRLTTMVTNPITRHPAVTATAIATVNAYAGGRAVLGIGTGDSAVINIGERQSSFGYFEDYVRTVKALLAGEEATWQGHSMRLRWPAPRVPIWLAAEGPRTLRLAGEIADGVFVTNGFLPEVVADVHSQLATGAARAGRELSDIEVWWMSKGCIADSREQAWRKLQFSLAGTAHLLFRVAPERKFVPDELLKPVRNLVEGYSSASHANHVGSEANAQLVEENGLTEWLGNRFLLAGTPDDIYGRLEELAAMGVTNFLLPQLVEDKLGWMAEFDELVLSRVRGSKVSAKGAG